MDFDKNIIYTSYDLALLLYTMNKNKYVCSSLKNNEWYIFSNHKWNIDEQGATLYNEISTTLLKTFNEKCKNIMSKIEDSKLIIENLKIQKKTQDKLKTTSFKMSILTEAKHLFYNNEFNNKLDDNRNLLCFNNGVYDLINDKFREGKPEDYISLSTNTDYKKYNKNDRYIKSLDNYFNQVFTNPNIKNYVLNLLSSYLHGHNPQERFIIWTGTGANSKSKLIELLCLALGDYAGCLPVSLLTHKRSGAGQASPEMALTKGKRFCYFQEPEETDKINVGLMKELTGNDKITARPLFKDPIEFKPQFKLVLCCNKLPVIPSTDGGTWRRLRVVNFGSKFVDNPKKDNEFKIDPYLSKNFKKWQVSLMSLLIDRYKTYKIKGLKEPQEVLKDSLKYKETSDLYLQFINDNLIEDKKESININQLYGIYKGWFRDSGNYGKPLPRKALKDYLLNNYSESIRNNIFYGYSFKENNNNELSNDLDS